MTVADVWSSKRVYVVRKMPTTEAGIVTFGLSQLYVSLGDPMADERRDRGPDLVEAVDPLHLGRGRWS